MQIDNLPTDNLYKLMAIAGLAVIFSSIGFFYLQIEKISNKLDEIELETATLTVEIEFHEQDMKSIQSLSHLDSVQTKLITEKGREIKRNLATIRVKLEIIKQLRTKIRVLGVAMLIFFIGGVMLSHYGFKLWYYRLQRYQDRIVELQAQNNQPPDASSNS